MSQRRTNNTKFYTITNIRDSILNSTEEDLNTLLLVCFIFLGSRGELLPWFIRLSTRRVDVDDVLALWAESLVKDGWDEE